MIPTAQELKKRAEAIIQARQNQADEVARKEIEEILKEIDPELGSFMVKHMTFNVQNELEQAGYKVTFWEAKDPAYEDDEWRISWM